MQDMRELRDEESYWIHRMAADAGTPEGRLYEAIRLRCLASVRAEIAEREASCGCDEHRKDGAR